ncbi:MAG TPA: chemotaxis protein CheW [Geobacterales bacterium]|nr:chemotaxis protein CheW [Geobacterales bacterium]
MAKVKGKKLPKSGLAEDILEQFVSEAQVEADSKQVKPKQQEGELWLHLVTFRLGREEYGVEIRHVQEIIRAGDITPVPGAPEHVRGVINLRGRIIPVIDLRRRFGLSATTHSEKNRIILVEVGEKRLGALVDSVQQVIRFSSTITEEVPEEVTSVERGYVTGIAKLAGRLVIILDLGRSLLVKGNGHS